MPARDPRAAARRGSAARSRALQAGARRARAAAHGRVPSPTGRKPLDKLPLSLVNQRGEPRYAKSTSKKTSRATPRTLGGDAAPEADVELGAPQQSGALAPSVGSRATRASSARGLDRDWLRGRARVSQGSTGTPTPIRPAPQARERPGARACLTAVTEPPRKTGDESRVPEASG